ncbi:MAG TPA: TGS domain-containing protein, partial [Steroidobacteraceae bacterium]|nr:TGS domain-containing protein [Steroidobacteraceae bacterium]
LNERRADRERYIDTLCTELNAELERAGVTAEVYGRPKHIYSIHRKMQRKQLAFEQIFDVRALRIVVGGVPECYTALGIVHGRWPYVPGEFDDYIATPKDNFYRSIHTAVIGPEGRSVEVQIRTREMHGHAELGVAAHWQYKEGGTRDADYDRKIQWVRRLLEPQDAADADRDFVERVRAELFEDRVYALTPKGEVVDLPRDATPLDFAYHVHTELGHRCRGAKVNGRIVPLNTHLANGEIVEIITGRQLSPSRDWLAPEQGYLASPRNRAKVRAWFRKQDAGDNRAAGRAIAERELTRVGAGPELFAGIVQELEARDADELYRLLGEGEITATQLVQAASRLTKPAEPPPLAPRRPRATAARRGSLVEIEGVGDLPITLARCCAPIRPQPIGGYVTLGRGVTIHRSDCAGFARMRAEKPERALNVEWSERSDSELAVELVISAYDRRGLVRDVSDVLALERLSIEAMTTTTDRDAGTALVSVSVAVKDLEQLARVLRRLGSVPNVIHARRAR